ncbi:tetratricopeptide repeat-containing sensor histidine kinase [Saccharicrinis fermentans]|uniref:histidine kinase n=1 Tax=Saccharicrinis fermentans DSM 9555 = JCM 21142 TaxID=869213 RepID=W7YPU0_9BACT|nr:HAMP domain-containing sensor histidine kinase [Saccharicrinis fermentans]GAF04469.1 histidine protein kinase DivJ [Saccharicrinis fermentans DSM 9555 = JCM 21142]
MLQTNVWGESRYVDSLIYKYERTSWNNKNDSLAYQLCYNISYAANHPQTALKYAILAYQHSIKFGDLQNQAASKFLESYPYAAMGKLDKAIASLLEAKKLYTQSNSKSGIATCLLKLAGIYENNRDFQLSEHSYLKAIARLKVLEDSLKISIAHINLGELYRHTNKLNDALHHFNLAAHYQNDSLTNSTLAYIQGNIGLVYTAQNKLDSAKLLLNKAIEILALQNDNYATSSYLDGLAHIYLKKGQYNKAEQIAHKSLHLAEEYGLIEQMRDACLRLSDIYQVKKNYKKAYLHHKQYVRYRDSINNEETIRKIAQFNTKYLVAQKQKEVDKEKEEKERYITVTALSVSVLSLLLVLSFFGIKTNKERKRTNLKLEEQRKELEIANATKNRFFSILSHDLRSPLATFHSYSEIIEICAKNNEVEQLIMISQEMLSSSANLLDLLDNLLQWGVYQMETVRILPTAINLKEAVLTEIQHLHHVASKKQIDIRTHIDPELTTINDQAKLGITIRNLINNAIKFTAPQGTVTISTAVINNKVALKIADSGKGMTPEQKDSFLNSRIINSTYGTQNEKGVGLGLQLVCEFIKNSGASISVDSKLNKGTCFTIIFENNKK